MKNSKSIFSIILILCLALAAVMTLSSCDGMLGTDPTTEHKHTLTEVAEVKPTCTENGVEGYYTCSDCKKLFADAEGSVEIDAPKVIEASGHDYKKTIYPNSCTDVGYTKYTCFDCGESHISDEVAAKGHTFNDYVSNADATCTEDGTKTAKCNDCGAVDTIADENTAIGHSFTNHISDGNATCTENGTKTARCDRCDATETLTDEGSVKGHSFTSYVDDGNATCTENGTKTAKCDRCDETETLTVENSAKGHAYSNAWTYDENGHRYVCANGCGIDKDEAAHTPNIESATEFEAKYCTVCTYVIEQALGHTTHNYTVPQNDETHHWNKCYGCNEIDVKVEHSYSESIDVNATCTDAGRKTLACDCGHSKTETIFALGHNEQAHEAKAPTCDEIGWNAYVTCTRCDYNTYEEIAAIGHDYLSTVTAPTCDSQGYTTHTCRNDDTHSYTDSYVDPLGHSYGEWTVATAPTYEIEGILSKTCANCSGTEEKNLGTASEENGYSLIIGGVLSRWEYSDGDFSFTVDLENKNAVTNTYSDDASAWYVGFDASGAMVKLDGYKTTNASWDSTNLSFGGSGMTYYTTVTAPKATTVTLIINCARNKAKPFFTSGTEHCIDNLTVNGSTDGVICFANAQLSVTGWHTYTDYAIATLFLKEGDNVISFKSATTVNFKGIGYVSTEELHIHSDAIDNAVAPTCLASGLTQGVHCSECNKILVAQQTVPTGGHSWSDGYTVLTAPTYTSEGSMVKKCTVCDVANEEIVIMPAVSVENGYTKTLDGVISRWEYSYNGTCTIVDVVESKEFDNYFFSANDAYNEGLGSHNSTYNAGGYFGDTSGDVFTTYITVPEATSVNFIIRGGSKDTRSYSGETIISKLTINGKTDGVVLTTELTKFQGWTNWVEFHAATLYLEEGVNIIKFSLSSNLNIAGISFDSPKAISLIRDYASLDLMSFNIRQDTDSGVKAWANRKDVLIASILAHNPSVICFQEVKKNQYEDIAAGLASASYEVVWYGRQSGSNPEGLAIAYKTDTWTKQSDRVFWLSDTPDVMSKGWDDAYYRICVNVLLKHNASGEMLDVYTVHLGLTETSRKNGMQLILDRVTGDYPTYIAGDFNCTNTMDAYLITAEKYVDCQIAAPTTEFDDTFQGWGSQVGDGSSYIIDFCFVSGKHFAPVTFDICQDKWGDSNSNYLSDHYALMTKVAMLIPHVHTEEIDEAVEATCTTEGKTEGKHCSTCGEVLVAQTVVDALGHTEVIDAKVDADCTSEGKTEGKHCSICKEVLVEQTVIEPLGHSYDNDLDADCNVCGSVRDASCAHANIVAISEAKAPTCTEQGNTAGEKCADCGEVFLKQEILSALGHTEVIDAAVAPTCINTGLTEGKHCSVCGEVLVAQNLIDALGHTNGAAVIENETVPTVTAAGSADIVVYCSVCNAEISRETVALPALNTVDYTTETTLAGTTATTVYTYSSDSISYSVSLTSAKYISVNNQVYSPYDVAKLNDGNVAVSFDDTDGFVYHANTEHTITQISTNGCSLTLTGNVVINSSASITFVGGNFNVGTDSAVANVTINSSVDQALLISSGKYKIIVNKGSSLAVNLDNASWMAVRFSHKETCNLNVYGTFTTNGVLSGNRYHIFSVYEGGSFTCGAYNNGQGNEIRVEGGVMNVTGNLVQTKNSKVTVAAGGTLNVGGTLKVADAGGVLTVNGTVNVGGNITNAATFTIGETGRCYVTGTANIAPTVTAGGYAKIGETEYGTPPASSTETEE